MLSIQEMLDKTVDQRKAIKNVLSAGEWHPSMASIYTNQTPAVAYEIRETMNSMSLAEFLGKTMSGTGWDADYLIPDKLHDTLIFYSKTTDIVPLIGFVAERWEGGDLKVDVVNDHTYKPQPFASGGGLPTETMETDQFTITPKSFALKIPIGNDLVEDSQWDIIEYHTQKAALAMGEYASDLALNVLKTATDGWGTMNAIASGSGVTTYLNVLAAVDDLGEDLWKADTMIVTPEALEHTILTDVNATGVLHDLPLRMREPAEGFDFKLLTLDVLTSTSPELHLSTDAVGAAFLRCKTIIFNRQNALLTGRKRWMKIENYSNPIADLSGAVVSCRQDSVTLYDDAIAVITEAA